MSGEKKHPLEIFRSSGRPLGSAMPKTPEGTQDAALRSARKAVRPLSELELRLTLPGALVLLFVWVVLMGAAYLYGHSRGRVELMADQDRTALAKGRAMESVTGVPPGTEASSHQSMAQRPYGVLLITYDGRQDQRIRAMTKLLRERYGIHEPVLPWNHKNGKVEVFLGLFDRSDDPQLKKLAADVRKIRDWPSGKDSQPFVTALIKRQPGVPPQSAQQAGP